MTNEMIKDEMINDEELDKVAGGTKQESKADCEYITKWTGIQFPKDYNNQNTQLYDFLRGEGYAVDTHRNKPNVYSRVLPNGKLEIVPREVALHNAVISYRRKHEIG
ncbi:MAG: hypothetical protein K6G55_04190 [Selenomonadaceae bacterium]|nr:hypothetical protein [Selenomonadaceae bacterium]